MQTVAMKNCAVTAPTSTAWVCPGFTACGPTSGNPASWEVPPHCLKKSGTWVQAHWSRRSVRGSRSGSGPRSGSGRRKGSSDKNLVCARVRRSASMRVWQLSPSTLTSCSRRAISRPRAADSPASTKPSTAARRTPQGNWPERCARTRARSRVILASNSRFSSQMLGASLVAS